MLPGDFIFIDNFQDLTPVQVQEAIFAIEGTWTGVNTLWGILPKVTRESKRRLCMNYLVAWYLADMYPSKLKGVYNNSGAPLRSKEVGGVYLTFKDRKVQGDLESLTSNIYGLKALDMLVTCPDMFLIR